jgi:hypothetical protein
VSELAESVLRYPRLWKTMQDAKEFNGQTPPPASTKPQSQYNMRSAMDIHPKVGKWISKKSIKQDPAGKLLPLNLPSTRFIDASEVDPAVAGIKRDGFYVFKHTAPTEVVQALRSFAESAPSVARGAGTAPGPYPRSNPAVGRYDIDEEPALASAEVQEFATDPLMGLIAQKYLGQPVLMDEVAFWWTTNKRAEDANVNAQLFHQDRDRLSFLKFFIYLTDVQPDTGPHVYLKGSHLGVPRSLRGDGRKTDEAVRAAGLWNNVTEICGPAGTLMAVDTIGLHKGKTPINGDRLALENEFATSLFGMDYEMPHFTPTQLTKGRIAAYSWVFQRYAAK